METKEKKSQVSAAVGCVIGGIAGAALALRLVLRGEMTGASLGLGLLLVPIWMIIGVALGTIVQNFLEVTLRIGRAKPWEEGTHKVVRRETQGESMKDPFAILNILALLITGGAVLFFLAMLGLLYAPVLLK